MKDELLKKMIYVGSAKKFITSDALPDSIYKASGLDKHVANRHPDCIAYIKRISEIIENPDYVGKSPKEQGILSSLLKSLIRIYR